MRKLALPVIVFVSCFSAQSQSFAIDSVTVSSVTDAALTHLSAKAIKVSNNQDTPIIISNLAITGHESQVQIYSGDDLENSCVNGQKLDKDNFCYVWLQAKKSDDLGTVTFNLPISFDYSAVNSKTINKWSSTYSVTIDNSLYVGGSFSKANIPDTQSMPANNIAKWNGKSWELLGTPGANGVDNSVYSIVTNGLDIYIGGWFNHANPPVSNIDVFRLARWNGNWVGINNVPVDHDPLFYSLAIGKSAIYAGGGFDADPHYLLGRIEKDAFYTIPQGEIPLSQIHAMAAKPGSDDLYVGDDAGQTGFWSKSDESDGVWKELTTTNLGSIIYTLAPYGNNVYFGGTFSAPEKGDNYLAGWDLIAKTFTKLNPDDKFNTGSYFGVTGLVQAGDYLV